MSPFLSKSQMRGAFSGKLGQDMKTHADEWMNATHNVKDLPEHVMNKIKKKSIIKKLIKNGKGGLPDSSFKQASSPIDLLKTKGEPPTAQRLSKTPSNS